MRGIRPVLAALGLILTISAVPAEAGPTFSWQTGTWQPDAVSALASNGRYVWAITAGGFRRYDVLTAVPDRTIFYDPTAAEWQVDHHGWQPMSGYESATYDSQTQSLWLISRQDRVLMQVDEDTAAVKRTYYDPTHFSTFWQQSRPYPPSMGTPCAMGVPWVVRAAFNYIWVLDTAGWLHKFDPMNGTQADCVNLGVKRGAGRVALTSDGKVLWASAMDSSWLGFIDPTTLKVTPVVPGPPPGPWYATKDELRFPVSVAVDSIGHVWVSEYEGRIRTYDSNGNLLNDIDSPLMEPMLSTNGSVVWAVTAYPPSSTSPGDPVMLSIDSASMTTINTRTPVDMGYPGFHAVTDVLFDGSSLWFAAFNNAYRESRVGMFTPPKPPGLPRLIDARPSASGELVVSWGAPTTDGGSPITGYAVQVRKDGGGPWMPCLPGITGSPTATAATCGGLDNLRSYLVQVAAKNLVGQGLPAQSTEVWPVPSPGFDIFPVERLTDTSSVVNAVVSGATPGASLTFGLSVLAPQVPAHATANSSGQAKVAVTTNARIPLGGWGRWFVRQGVAPRVVSPLKVAVPSVTVNAPPWPGATAQVRMNRYFPASLPAEQPTIAFTDPAQGCGLVQSTMNPITGTAVFRISHPFSPSWQCDLTLDQTLSSGERWSRTLHLH